MAADVTRRESYESNQEHIGLLRSKALFNVDKCLHWVRLGIHLQGLSYRQLSSTVKVSAIEALSHLTEVRKIPLLVSLLEVGPCLLRNLVGDIVQIEFAVFLAVQSFVSCLYWQNMLFPFWKKLDPAICCIPSFLQFLQTSAGFSGHSAAGCPSWLQIRQVPLKTRGLVHSALV